MRSSSLLLILSVALLGGSCGSAPDLEPVPNGAFLFVDGGEAAGFERYRLTLPERLDLDRAQVVRRELAWCPETELVGYLDLALPLPLPGAKGKMAYPWSATTLELRLEDVNGGVVFRERAPLREWVWSGAVGGPRTSLYTSKTVFKPKGEGPFVLVAEVVPTGEGAPSGTLALRGGGWKQDGDGMPASKLFR